MQPIFLEFFSFLCLCICLCLCVLVFVIVNMCQGAVNTINLPQIYNTRSLVSGPSGLLDFVLRAPRALRPCDPRHNA